MAADEDQHRAERDEALAPTQASSETIRAGGGAVAPATLPTLSIDLRAALEHPAPAGSDLEVLSVLGEGGMGRVLLARQRSLSRDVAVKTSLPGAPESAGRAILAEGAIAGSLEHPAIVPVHALGLDAGGLPVLVMKRVDGVSWDGLLADATHPGWEGWEGDATDRLPGHLQVLTAVCHALHFAHSRGVVHLDVKPPNVLIGRFGDAYLADWGVAARAGSRLTGVCGTPAFLAPEMATGGVVDARTDVFLLGATLHLLLTGRARNEGASVAEALERASLAAPFAYGPATPPELAELANRACHVDPARRPQSAAEFREALVRYVRHRDARALAEQAIARVSELEALLRVAEPSPQERAHGERLLAEARFGLEQSLRQHPENPRAREALARVEAVEGERRRRIEALEHEVQDRDPVRGARRRLLGTALLTGVGAVAVGALHAVGLAKLRPEHLVASPAAGLGVVLVVGVRFRRWLYANRFDRELFMAVALGVGVLVLGRLIGYFEGAPYAVQMTRDALAQMGVMAVCAVAYLRWLWGLAGIFAAATMACAAFPAHALPLYGAATSLALAFATVMALLEARALGRR